mmetsp:Transcript_7674/g.22532  ORF Transcript_7674/g.22532 Transcript_7674/m.22532 type:complete len:450 (+) Transcript_7674:633-1982(+)
MEDHPEGRRACGREASRDEVPAGRQGNLAPLQSQSDSAAASTRRRRRKRERGEEMRRVGHAGRYHAPVDRRAQGGGASSLPLRSRRAGRRRRDGRERRRGGGRHRGDGPPGRTGLRCRRRERSMLESRRREVRPDRARRRLRSPVGPAGEGVRRLGQRGGSPQRKRGSGCRRGGPRGRRGERLDRRQGGRVRRVVRGWVRERGGPVPVPAQIRGRELGRRVEREGRIDSSLPHGAQEQLHGHAVVALPRRRVRPDEGGGVRAVGAEPAAAQPGAVRRREHAPPLAALRLRVPRRLRGRRPLRAAPALVVRRGQARGHRLRLPHSVPTDPSHLLLDSRDDCRGGRRRCAGSRRGGGRRRQPIRRPEPGGADVLDFPRNEGRALRRGSAPGHAGRGRHRRGEARGSDCCRGGGRGDQRGGRQCGRGRIRRLRSRRRGHAGGRGRRGGGRRR